MMTKTIACLLASATAFAAVPAFAASDIFLEIQGVDGEAAAAPIEVDSWSFGTCSAGQCSTVTSSREMASGMATGKTGSPSRATWDLAKGKGARMASGAVVGDVDGDGRADLAYAGTQDSVQNLTLTFDKASPQLAKVCGGKHFDKVVLRIGGESYEIVDGTVSCTAPQPGAAARTIDQTPARISTNVSTPRQTQGASFGEKVSSGLHAAGSVVVQFTSGQMKHTKSGHVTLMK